MYRHCKCSKCNQCNYKEDMLEDICDDVDFCNCNNTEECECGFDEEWSPFPANYMYGQSYVPIQKMKQTFTPEAGLRMGTIFPELVSPYCPGQSMEEIEYLRNTNSIGEGCNNA